MFIYICICQLNHTLFQYSLTKKPFVDIKSKQNAHKPTLIGLSHKQQKKLSANTLTTAISFIVTTSIKCHTMAAL